MKIIIAGSRSIKDYGLVKGLIDESLETFNISTVISGHAYGVDRLAEQWAEENGIPVILKPANWDDISSPDAIVKHSQRGKAYNALAGHWRNEEMARIGDALILIHDGVSTGSLDMLNRAKNHGLPILKHTVDIVKHTKDSKLRAMEEAVKWAKAMREDKNTVVVDTESCGGNKNDEIISIAIVRLHDGAPLFHSLLRPKPDVKFNWYATKVHGITQEKLIGKPTIAEVWDSVRPLLENRNVLAFNHSSDKRMIEQTLRKHSLDIPEINWYCIMKAYKNFTQDSAVTNLTKACSDMNVKAGTHDALDDALAAARIVFRISQEYKINEVSR